jgi:hypothetical protein
MIGQGDKCWVQLPLKRHYGVCTGFGSDGRPLFVHNTFDGGVVQTTEHGFAGGHPIHVEQRAQPGQEASVAQRALNLIGRQYDLFTFNCEHAANLAATGRAESKQVQGAVKLVGLGLLLAYFNQNGTSVDRNGYRRNGRGEFASRRWW